MIGYVKSIYMFFFTYKGIFSEKSCIHETYRRSGCFSIYVYFLYISG